MKILLSIALGLSLCATAAAQDRVARVGYLSWQDSGVSYQATLKGFLEGLRSEGFVVGKNLDLMRRSGSNDTESFKPLARELAAAKVDVFFAPHTAMATAAWYADKNTPIVIATIVDPVELKFVKSLGRPGMRVTGVTTMSDELVAKRMQLLMEMVPGLKRVGVLIDDAMRDACKQEVDQLTAAANKLGLTLVMVNVDRPEAMDAGFRKLVGAKVQAVMTTFVTTRNGMETEEAEATFRHRLPSITSREYGVRQGGLMSYGPDMEDIFRRAGHYVARILKGEKPAEMAMEQPRQFRLVVNLKTAKELGITVPQSVLARADEVIQ